MDWKDSLVLKACVLALAVGACVGFSAGLAVGITHGACGILRDAAQHNAGRYTANEKTGETKWEWTGRVP